MSFRKAIIACWTANNMGGADRGSGCVYPLMLTSNCRNLRATLSGERCSPAGRDLVGHVNIISGIS
jgi:hypothetical protein